MTPNVKAIIATRGGKGAYRIADGMDFAAFTTEPIIIKTNPDEPTKDLTTHGRVTGRLIGGNQDATATGAGWALPSFDGAILLLEAVGMRLGHIDRQLTMLMNSGNLRGVKGGLSIGHGEHPIAVPIGTMAMLDARAG